MSTKVSVIVPTFNRSKQLVEAVSSVLMQKYANWELLVVDDGSTDGTEIAMRQFLADSRIKYFRQKNRGQASARNVGIHKSQGELVAFLDSDNRWLPHKLSTQVEFMDSHRDVDVLYGETERIDGGGHSWPSPVRKRYSGVVWRNLLIDNFVNFNTSMVRRERLIEVGGMSEGIRRGDDYDLWLRLSAGSRFQFVPGIVAQYRVVGTRISDDVSGRMRSNQIAVENFLQSNPGLLTDSEVRHIRARILGRFARAFSSRGQMSRGLALSVRAVWYAPFLTDSWRTLAAVCVEPLRKSATADLDRIGPPP